MYVGLSSLVNSPETLPPKISNLPPSCAPSKTLGGARVKAAIRWGSVNVRKSWSASVRNSCWSLRDITLTWEVPEVAVVEELFDSSLALLTEELSRVRGELKPDDGLLPGACWRSLPSLSRSSGVICERTMSFCLEASSP